MRTLRLLIAAAAAVCLVNSASAELIIFKGSLKQTATGLGVSQKINSQFYLIVDHDTAAFAQVEYLTVNGSKTYATMTETNFHFVQVTGAKGKTIQAISQPPSDCDTNEGITSDSVFVQGADSALLVDAGTTITFPKTLSGAGGQVDYSQGPPIYIASSLVLGFDAKQTPLSNGNGETLDAAISRISTMLEGQGYQKQSEKKAKGSKYPLSLLRD